MPYKLYHFIYIGDRQIVGRRKRQPIDLNLPESFMDYLNRIFAHKVQYNQLKEKPITDIKVEFSYGRFNPPQGKYDGKTFHAITSTYSKDQFEREEGRKWIEKRLKQAINIYTGQKHTSRRIKIPEYIEITS